MTTAIHLCTPDDADQLLALIARCHAETGLNRDDAHRRAATLPLLNGATQGAAYLFGPRRAPTGYVIVSFGWSIAAGGMDAMLDELFVRPGVRRRGIAAEVLIAIAGALRDGGIKALHVASSSDPGMQALYIRAGFTPDSTVLMTRRF